LVLTFQYLFKDEAFNLWYEKWGVLYDPGSESRKIIENIQNNYVLVNLVDNDYPRETCLWSILDNMFELKANEDVNNNIQN
jgi:methylenetetrahydrofolate reductase (NADPH)